MSDTSETSDTKKTAADDNVQSFVRADDGSVTLRLRKPVTANGDEVSELKFREPTGGDIERIGCPVIIDFLSSDVPKTTFDSKIMTQMMAHLAGVPPSAIKAMNPRDCNTGAWMLSPFFMPEM